MPEFAVNVRHLPDGLLLDVTGPVGQEGGEAIRRVVEEASALPARLVFNLTGAHPISTAGIGGILYTVRLVTRAGGRAAAYGLSDHHRKVFHVMGLTQYIRLCLDEASALE